MAQINKHLPDNLMTPSEFAQLHNVNVRTVYYHMDRGQIPWDYIGGQKRIVVDGFDDPKHPYYTEASYVRQFREHIAAGNEQQIPSGGQ